MVKILPTSPSSSPGTSVPLPGPGSLWACSQERRPSSGSRGSTPSRLLRLLLLLRSREPEVDRQVSASQGESLWSILQQWGVGGRGRRNSVKREPRGS